MLDFKIDLCSISAIHPNGMKFGLDARYLKLKFMLRMRRSQGQNSHCHLESLGKRTKCTLLNGNTRELGIARGPRYSLDRNLEIGGMSISQSESVTTSIWRKVDTLATSIRYPPQGQGRKECEAPITRIFEVKFFSMNWRRSITFPAPNFVPFQLSKFTRDIGQSRHARSCKKKSERLERSAFRTAFRVRISVSLDDKHLGAGFPKSARWGDFSAGLPFAFVLLQRRQARRSTSFLRERETPI